MKIIALFLILIIIGGQLESSKLANLPEVEKPFNIIISNERLFVSDRTVKLHIYSMKDFRYIKQITRKGEGPGECRTVPKVTPYRDYIAIYTRRKCMFFSRNGDYEREFRTKIRGIITISPLNEIFVVYKHGMNSKNDNYYRDISLYTFADDKDFKFKKVIYYLEKPPEIIRGGKKDYTVLNDYLGFVVQNDKIFVGDSSRGLFVAVFDSNGKEINRINLLEVDKIKVTERYKKEFMERAKRQPSYNIIKNMYNIIFPEYFPGFYRFAVDNGKVYFLTYLRKDDKREMIIVDLKSKIFQRTFVPWVENEAWINFSIENGKFYYIMENDEEEVWELHMEAIK
jgi:hypothetical protein